MRVFKHAINATAISKGNYLGNFSYRFTTTAQFDFKEYTNLCQNEFFRYAPNPKVTGYLLTQQTKDLLPTTICVSQFSSHPIFKNPIAPFDETWIHTEKYTYRVPKVEQMIGLSAFRHPDGQISFHGRSSSGDLLVSHPECEIDITPALGCSQHYTYYAMRPAYSPIAPIQTIPRLKNTDEAKKILREKGGQCKSGKALKIINSDVLIRSKLFHRNPDQNTVMGKRAVDAYRECAKQYKSVLHPEVADMIHYASKIIHLSALLSMIRHGHISIEKMKTHKHDRRFRPEWLHRNAYGVHPMATNPQRADNLGAGRALDNTRMLLLERFAKWMSLNEQHATNTLNGCYDMLLDTQVIDYISLKATTTINGSTIALDQKIDALSPNPQHIAASDMAGLIGLCCLLLQNTKPTITETLRITPAPVVIRPWYFFKKPALNDHKSTPLTATHNKY